MWTEVLSQVLQKLLPLLPLSHHLTVLLKTKWADIRKKKKLSLILFTFLRN
jgi:hypothetical protein